MRQKKIAAGRNYKPTVPRLVLSGRAFVAPNHSKLTLGLMMNDFELVLRYDTGQFVKGSAFPKMVLDAHSLDPAERAFLRKNLPFAAFAINLQQVDFAVQPLNLPFPGRLAGWLGATPRHSRFRRSQKMCRQSS